MTTYDGSSLLGSSGPEFPVNSFIHIVDFHSQFYQLYLLQIRQLIVTIHQLLDTYGIKYTTLLWIWLVIEVMFYYIAQHLLLPRLQKRSKVVPFDNDPAKELRRTMDIVDAMNGCDEVYFIEGFCLKSKIQDIYKDNLRSFLSWAYLGKYVPMLNAAEKKKLDECFEIMENRYESVRNMKEGFNPNVKHCAVSLDTLQPIHRPLALYLASGLFDVLMTIFFVRLQGFQGLEMNGVRYWIRHGTDKNSSLPPLVFFHGISPGWSFYVLQVRMLTSGGKRTAILIDTDCIKIKSMVFTSLTIAQYTDVWMKIFQRHHFHQVSVVGHSFGTILAGWLVKRHPEVVFHLTLLDPVSILLSLPDVAYSFVYRPPKSVIEWVIHLGASRELTISYLLHRNFCWHKNMLWLEDVPAEIGVVVGIGSNDEVANAALIKEYTIICQRKRQERYAHAAYEKAAEIQFVGWDNYSHGQVLLVPSKLRDLRNMINNSEFNILGKAKGGAKVSYV